MPETESRTYDIVLFGATGFTGELTGRYLAEHAPEGCRWALAGRTMGKLEAVRDRLAEIDPRLEPLPLLAADIGDAASMREMAESTRVVITTVGPYINYGEPLVAACAAAGTDYVDLTGEPEFVDLMYTRHHARAAESGARIVHCCGFDSIPHDLGALFTVEQLPEGVALTVKGYVRAGGKPSGGTFHTMVTAMSRAGKMAAAAKARRAAEERPAGRRVHGERALPHRDSEAGGWVVPMPTVDPQIVLASARALERYGPDFTYSHNAVVKRLPVLLGAGAGLAGMAALAQLPPTRNWLLGRLSPGEGPSEEQRAKSWFKVRFVGEGGGKRVVTQVSGGDPGYSETAKMLSESALSLAFDDLPASAGQVTTAQAMGDKLIERLQTAGIKFEVLEGPIPR